jgi:hypothetical protein
MAIPPPPPPVTTNPEERRRNAFNPEVEMEELVHDLKDVASRLQTCEETLDTAVEDARTDLIDAMGKVCKAKTAMLRSVTEMPGNSQGMEGIAGLELDEQATKAVQPAKERGWGVWRCVEELRKAGF